MTEEKKNSLKIIRIKHEDNGIFLEKYSNVIF